MIINDDIKRQAVIIIHGMGEQRPMETLRSFVTGVKKQLEYNDPSEIRAQVRSKPDSIGDIYETTRLSLEGNYSTKRPITDFYEFYWAHNMRGTKFTQMFTWLKNVVFKWVGNVPPRLKPIWWTIWSLIILTFITTIVVMNLIDSSTLKKWIAPLVTGTFIPFIFLSVQSFLKTSVLNSLGDVARYLTPEPDNIQERSQIRQQGIKFLEKMHSIKNRTKPDRIIVVAHSLGSVVAYDLLRLLWTEYNNIYTTAPVDKEPMLDIVNDFSVAPDSIDQPDLNTFQKAQYNCWKEARALGNPWLITDFITLGAALNAIDYFMITKVGIEELKKERELPVCPPAIDEKDKEIFYEQQIDVNGVSKKVKVLNHGALFGMTRWTNIYYTSDFVGGNMQRVFGKGVRDISIHRKSCWFLPGGHTDYWNEDDQQNALKQIVDALKLS